MPSLRSRLGASSRAESSALSARSARGNSAPSASWWLVMGLSAAGCSSSSSPGDGEIAGGAGAGGMVSAAGSGGDAAAGRAGAAGGGAAGGSVATTGGAGSGAGGFVGAGAGAGGAMAGSGGAMGGGAAVGGAGAMSGAGAGAGGTPGGSAGQSGGGSAGADSAAKCRMIKEEYAKELDRQLGCNPSGANQCKDTASAAPGCSCRVYIQPTDPFAIEHLANVADGWYSNDCSMPMCPSSCVAAAAGKCQADSKYPGGGRCVTP